MHFPGIRTLDNIFSSGVNSLVIDEMCRPNPRISRARMLAYWFYDDYFYVGSLVQEGHLTNIRETKKEDFPPSLFLANSTCFSKFIVDPFFSDYSKK